MPLPAPPPPSSEPNVLALALLLYVMYVFHALTARSMVPALWYFWRLLRFSMKTSREVKVPIVAAASSLLLWLWLLWLFVFIEVCIKNRSYLSIKYLHKYGRTSPQHLTRSVPSRGSQPNSPQRGCIYYLLNIDTVPPFLPLLLGC